MKERIKSLIYPEKKRQMFWYLTLSGVLSGSCMTFPTHLGALLEWISFIPAALALFSACRKRVSLKRAYLGSFWLIYSQHIIVYHWFVSFYPLDFTGMSKLAAAGVVFIAIFGLSFLAAMFSGFLGVIVVALARLKALNRYPIFLPFLASAAYVLNEWIRTMFWIGVPWSRLSLGQLTEGIPYSVLTSSVFGTYFVTFLIVLVSFLAAQALFLGKIKLRCTLAAVLIVANLLGGVVTASLPTDEKTTLTVAAIQGNINSRDKWDGSKTAVSIFNTYCDLTVEAAEDGAELIVWPETSLPDNYFIPYLCDLCREYGIYLLFGTFDFNENNDPGNALYLITPEGELSDNIYLKRHLVPFGEYVPMRNLIMTVFPPLGEIAMLEYDLLPGNDSNLYTARIDGVELNLGSLICFDSIYEELAYDSASDGADIICVATNDSWFEDSRAVYMHCAQSRLRAIETRTPIVRAANTGISAVITQRGEAVEVLAPLERGYVIADVPIPAEHGNAQIANELFLWLMIFMLYTPLVFELGIIISNKRKANITVC